MSFSFFLLDNHRMPSRTDVPYDIVAQIFEDYNALNQRDTRTLAALCLVSRTWKQVAQPHLWKVAWCVRTSLASNSKLGQFVDGLGLRNYRPDCDSNVFQVIANCCPNLMDCSTMNDQDLVQLAENCTQLDFLIVYHTPQISESGWLKAASFLKHLRKLSVGENLHFQDTAIRAVINSCPKLQEFSISKTGITCEGISYIMGHAPRLDQLYLEYNQRIRRQQIEAILWQKPAHLDLEVYSAGENPIFSEATERNVGDQ
ncbi:hypothetical protein DFS34DRAFT_446018 [Phlyctochytrium arcticum]|nr:hypothetical protein DFS34DRAFT_446018 [Phlyctochytrium arcticum]